MNTKQRIEELERRVSKLEKKPVYVPQSSQPPIMVKCSKPNTTLPKLLPLPPISFF